MALTAHRFLELVADSFESVERFWSHPFLRLIIRAPGFAGADDETREEHFAAALGQSVAALTSMGQRTFIRWELLAPEETPAPITARGTSWLDALDTRFSARRERTALDEAAPRFVHFYGFKGGQGRSTTLALMARVLAEDGWRVLAVDFDAEAPSLDVIFGISTTDIAATVLGLRMAEPTLRPVGLGRTPAYGEVALMPFRPEATAFDLDSAALAYELQGYPPGAEAMCQQLRTLVAAYDLVLIDHRTGLGPLVPLLVRDLPGPVLNFARLDGQSRGGRSAAGALWALADATPPGALVSVAPPEESEEQFRERTRAEGEDLLQHLAEAYGRSQPAASAGGEDEGRGADEVLDHWFVLPFDAPLARSSRLPQLGIGSDRFDSLRRLLRIDGIKKLTQKLEPSGASDEGDLIITQALRNLKTPNNPYTIIVGRKGTGKTRLVKELTLRGLGQPLLVPSDVVDTAIPGIRAGALGLKELVARFRESPDLLWVALLTAALEGGTTEQAKVLAQASALGRDEAALYGRLRAAALTQTTRTTYFVDALESAFDLRDTFPFVSGLFRIIEMLDSTPELSRALKLQVFIRKDLVDKGIQNREQLESGRRIDLSWDLRTIFNFALSRIASIDWYRDCFPTAIQQIDEALPRIREGQLEVARCEALLLEVFPEKLAYKNIYTSTFLKTYFSDETRGESMFYPRIYVFFFEALRRLHQAKEPTHQGKLDGTLVVKAHEQASREFLQEVRQELVHAAGITDSKDVDAVIEKLEGKVTPFDVGALVKSVVTATVLEPDRVRRILDAMKQLGIFEDYPKRPNQWRSGRLFKTALGMRFRAASG